MYLFLLGDFLLWLGNDLLLLSEDHLNVAWGAHVRVNSAVGTVGAPSHLWGLVDLDVLDNQRVHIQTLQYMDSILTSTHAYVGCLTHLLMFITNCIYKSHHFTRVNTKPQLNQSNVRWQ